MNVYINKITLGWSTSKIFNNQTSNFIMDSSIYIHVLLTSSDNSKYLGVCRKEKRNHEIETFYRVHSIVLDTKD